MTGLRIHKQGRNGEEVPLTEAQRNNQAVWHRSRRERFRFWIYRNQARFVGIGFAALVIWLAFFDTRGGW